MLNWIEYHRFFGLLCLPSLSRQDEGFGDCSLVTNGCWICICHQTVNMENVQEARELRTKIYSKEFAISR